MPPQSKPNNQQISYRPVPFNFVDLEEKASDFLAKTKAEAVKIASDARNEVAKIRKLARQEREKALAEVETARGQAKSEADALRKQLDELHQKLQSEEENFKKRKEQLETEAVKLKSQLKQNEDTARKNGYEDGKKLGYDEGHSKGYSDGELKATIDYADKVRSEAEIQLGTQLETLLPALQTMIERLETAKQSFLQLWEQSAIKTAMAIAERAISRQLPKMVDVPIKLLREALELGAGSASVRIRLNPDDYEALRPQMDILIREMTKAAETEIIPDIKITSGGCVLETSLGVIDNQIESRLERIEQELVLSDL
jgi:flagellar biosynthesis/type III secretory pathway protein FliH